MGGIVNKCWRIVARVLGVLSAVLAVGSCGWLGQGANVQALYGPVYVQLPIGVVGYQPPSPVHTGALLIFTAELPQGAISEAVVNAGTAEKGWHQVELLNDGVLPDQSAGDRIFTGQLEWKADYGTGEMPVMLSVNGTLNGRDAYGSEYYPTLTVLP